MIIQLEIPKEFAKDYANNRFDDFFRRVYVDIDNEGIRDEAPPGCQLRS